MLGLSALFITVPFIYESVKWAGAVYLIWLAWNAVKQVLLQFSSLILFLLNRRKKSATLGLTQIAVSFTINLLIVLIASKVAMWFGTRPTWLRVQRWLMASVLTGLAASLAFDRR